MEDVRVDYFTDEGICVTCSGEKGGECAGNGRDVEKGCAADFPVNSGVSGRGGVERGGIGCLRCGVELEDFCEDFNDVWFAFVEVFWVFGA